MKEFSTATRAELARINPDHACCTRAELGGIMRAAGSLHLHGLQQISLSIRTEHPDVARKVMLLLRSLAGEHLEVMVEEHGHPRKNRAFHIQMAPGPGVKHLLMELGVLTAGGEIQGDIAAELVRKDCCRASFLRGAYMMRGSVCDPRGASYHLEIVAQSEEFGLGLCYLLNLARFKAHLAMRKGQHVVYLKDADDIASFLSFIGAHNARLELEEIRVVKEVRGEVNRLVNAETANVDKTVAAALSQVEMIEGENEEQKAEALAKRLVELKVL